MEHSCEGPPGRWEPWGPLSLIASETAWGEEDGLYQESSQPLSLCTWPRKVSAGTRIRQEPWHLSDPWLCLGGSLTQRCAIALSACQRLRSRVCKQHSVCSWRFTCFFYLSEPEQPRLSAPTLQVVKELRAAGWLWRRGEAFGKGRHAVPSGRVLPSPEAVCNSNTNTSMLWVPSWYDSNPIPLGVWNTLDHARLFIYIYICVSVFIWTHAHFLLMNA